MEMIKKSIEINAPKEKIWNVLLSDETYPQWTSVFNEGSYAEGGWDEGNTVYFKSPEGDGLKSKVLVHKPNEKITFEHLAMMKSGKEITDDPDMTEWAGAHETYTLAERDGKSLLNVEMDTTEKYADYFDKTWDKALQKVKELSEK